MTKTKCKARRVVTTLLVRSIEREIANEVIDDHLNDCEHTLKKPEEPSAPLNRIQNLQALGRNNDCPPHKRQRPNHQETARTQKNREQHEIHRHDKLQKRRLRRNNSYNTRRNKTAGQNRLGQIRRDNLQRRSNALLPEAQTVRKTRCLNAELGS